MSVIIFYNCQIDAIKIKGIREPVKKEFPGMKMVSLVLGRVPSYSTLVS